MDGCKRALDLVLWKRKKKELFVVSALPCSLSLSLLPLYPLVNCGAGGVCAELSIYGTIHKTGNIIHVHVSEVWYSSSTEHVWHDTAPPVWSRLSVHVLWSYELLICYVHTPLCWERYLWTWIPGRAALGALPKSHWCFLTPNCFSCPSFASWLHSPLASCVLPLFPLPSNATQLFSPLLPKFRAGK